MAIYWGFGTYRSRQRAVASRQRGPGIDRPFTPEEEAAGRRFMAVLAIIIVAFSVCATAGESTLECYDRLGYEATPSDDWRARQAIRERCRP